MASEIANLLKETLKALEDSCERSFDIDAEVDCRYCGERYEIQRYCIIHADDCILTKVENQLSEIVFKDLILAYRVK